MVQDIIKEDIMSKSLMDKIKFFWGFESADEELIEEEFANESTQFEDDRRPYLAKEKTRSNSNKRKNRVVNIHNNAAFKIDVYEPRNFEEAAEIVECLRSRRPVIVNLEDVDAELARKVFDFLSGALCAIDGKAEKISKAIFLMAPNNVQIANFKSAINTSRQIDSTTGFSLTD